MKKLHLVLNRNISKYRTETSHCHPQTELENKTELFEQRDEDIKCDGQFGAGLRLSFAALANENANVESPKICCWAFMDESEIDDLISTNRSKTFIKKIIGKNTFKQPAPAYMQMLHDL